MQITDDRVQAGLRERTFWVERDGRRVPGVLWSPEVTGSHPLVLIGHGGSGSKRASYVVATARALARRYGIATAAIDGPVHGDRRADPDAPAGLVLMEFAQLWGNDGDQMTDDMVADWRATIDALTALPELAGNPIGWWGVSLGTIIGLPLVAADPRISVAVLGLMGLTGPTRQRLDADAPRIACPVLFLVQWGDELFARPDVLALYDALATTDKRLHAHPGGHGALPDEAFVDSGRFLAEHLS